MKTLQDKGAIIQVLGGLIKNPKTLLDNRYSITMNDFPELFHRSIFVAVNNIVSNSGNIADVQTITNVLKGNDRLYKVYMDNRGMEWVTKAIAYHTPDNFDFNYNTMKKFTLLRDLQDNMGLDISEIYNPNETDLVKSEVQYQKLQSMSTEDIIEHFNKKWTNFKKGWNDSFAEIDTFLAGDGIDDLIAELGQTPDRGYPFINKTISEITRGMRRKKFYLFSAPTGMGKSRFMISNACNLCMPETFNIKTNQWEKNPHTTQNVTYIATELTKKEVQEMVLAYVSAVEEDRIKNGDVTPEEAQRIIKASRMIKTDKFKCICVPDFDIEDIECIIAEEANQRKSKYIFFDYIHQTPKLAGYYSKKTGGALAEHQVLYLFGNALKNLANKYDVFMYTSTQVNRQYKDNKDGEMDATMIRGALSLADKTDVAGIITEPTDKELKLLEDIIKQTFGDEPNTCYSIYKNRGNKYKNIKVWTRMNLGIMREEVLFVTDYNYKVIFIKEDESTFRD